MCHLKNKFIFTNTWTTCIEMGTTEGVLNSNTYNEIKLVKLLDSYFYLQGSLNCVLMSKYFGDVYVFSM